MSAGKAADKATAGVAAKLDILGLNYGQTRYEQDCIKYPDRVMVGCETLKPCLKLNISLVH